MERLPCSGLHIHIEGIVEDDEIDPSKYRETPFNAILEPGSEEQLISKAELLKRKKDYLGKELARLKLGDNFKENDFLSNLEIKELLNELRIVNAVEWMDMRMTSVFDKKQGFYFGVDQIIAPEAKNPFVCIIHIFPPGGLYVPDDKVIAFGVQSDIDMNSKLGNQKILSVHEHFMIPSVKKSALIVIEVLQIKFEKKGLLLKLENFGSAFLPLFSNSESLNNGIFQLPLLKCDIQESVDKFMESEDPWSLFNKIYNIPSPKLSGFKYIRSSSIMVTLSDQNMQNNFKNNKSINKDIFKNEEMLTTYSDQYIASTVGNNNLKTVLQMFPQEKLNDGLALSKEITKAALKYYGIVLD